MSRLYPSGVVGASLVSIREENSVYHVRVSHGRIIDHTVVEDPDRLVRFCQAHGIPVAAVYEKQLGYHIEYVIYGNEVGVSRKIADLAGYWPQDRFGTEAISGPEKVSGNLFSARLQRWIN
jgi:hypothetical protein